MLKDIAPFVMIILMFFVVAKIVTSFLDYFLKRQMINQGKVDELGIRFISKGEQSKYDSLKWALLAFFGGIGLIVIDSLPQRMDDSTLPFGVLAVFLSIAFFIFFFIVNRNR